MARREDMDAIEKFAPRSEKPDVDMSRFGWAYLRYLDDDELRAVRDDLAEMSTAVNTESWLVGGNG